MTYRSVGLFAYVVLTFFVIFEAEMHSETLPAPQPEASATAGPVPENLLGAMRWRQVGPFRGGRVLAVTGVPGEPNVFYFGAVAGGVWESTNGGGGGETTFHMHKKSS